MLLAILMALTTGFSAMLPAFAEEGNEAMIDGTEYATLEAAIDAAGDGATITLLRDLTWSVKEKKLEKDLIIDGGTENRKITSTVGYLFDVHRNITFKNLRLDTTSGFRFRNTAGKPSVATIENVEWTLGSGLLVNIQGSVADVPQTFNVVNSTITKTAVSGDPIIATYGKNTRDITINIENSTLNQNGGQTSGNVGNTSMFFFNNGASVILNLKENSVLKYNPLGKMNAVQSVAVYACPTTINADATVAVHLVGSGAATAGNYFTYSTGSGTVTVNDNGAAWNVSAAIAERGFFFPTSGSYDVNETSKAVVEAGACCHGDTALTYRKAAGDYAENGLSETERLYSGYSFKVGTDYYKTWADALKAEGDIILIANAPHIDKQIRLAKDAIVDGQGKYVLSSSNYFFELVGHSATFRNLNLNVANGIGTGTGDGAAVLFENCKINVTGGLLLNIKAQTNVIFRNTTVVSTAADAAILLQSGATSEIKLIHSTIDYRKGNSGHNTSIINIASKSKGTVVLDGTSKLIYSPNSTGDKDKNQIITVHDAETAATVHLNAGAVLEYNTVPKSTTSLAFLRSNASLTLVDEGATWKVSAAVAKKGYSFVNTSGTFNCKTVAMKTADGKLYSPTEVIKLTAATAFAPVAMGVTNEAGASIRLDLPTGIRFGTQIDKTFYETLGASAVYGVRVARKDVLNGGSFAALTDENSVSYTSAKEGFRWVTEGEFFRTVLMNIDEANYQTELCWTAFVTVTYEGGKTAATYYADYTEADNCRSLAQVASRALQDTTVTWTTDETALLKTIAGVND